MAIRARVVLPAVMLALFGMSGAQAASVSYFLDQNNADPLLPDGVNYLKITISD